MSVFGVPADIQHRAASTISVAIDPCATSTGLKFRTAAVARVLFLLFRSGEILCSETAHVHHAGRPSVLAQDDGRRTEPATTEFVEWFSASALVQTLA